VSLATPPELIGIDKIRIGDLFRCAEAFTAQDMAQFSALSGDHSAIHTYPQTARRFGFPDRLQYGFLLTTLLSRIVGQNFCNALCAAVSIQFSRPVFPGDEVNVSAEVEQIQPIMRSVVLKITMTRKEVIVAHGKLTTVFLAEPEKNSNS
jgi:acyl dehydratase